MNVMVDFRSLTIVYHARDICVWQSTAADCMRRGVLYRIDNMPGLPPSHHDPSGLAPIM